MSRKKCGRAYSRDGAKNGAWLEVNTGGSLRRIGAIAS
jgi:hypothetical protein